MAEAFNRAGQLPPANSPGVGTQYDRPKATPAVPAAPAAPAAPVAPTGPPEAPVIQPGLSGPGFYADGTPIPTRSTGATGTLLQHVEAELQHIETELKGGTP